MAAGGSGRNSKGTLFRRHLFCRSGRLYVRRLRFDQSHDVLVHLCILHMMISDAGKIDHMLASAAASDADVRFAGLSRAIDDAAKYGERKRGMDMLKPLLKRLNSADDIKALS